MDAWDDFIFLGYNSFTGTDKTDGHEFTTYRIAFAVIPPDTFYTGYEVAAASVKKSSSKNLLSSSRSIISKALLFVIPVKV